MSGMTHILDKKYRVIGSGTNSSGVLFFGNGMEENCGINFTTEPRQVTLDRPWSPFSCHWPAPAAIMQRNYFATQTKSLTLGPPSLPTNLPPPLP